MGLVWWWLVDVGSSVLVEYGLLRMGLMLLSLSACETFTNLLVSAVTCC